MSIRVCAHCRRVTGYRVCPHCGRDTGSGRRAAAAPPRARKPKAYSDYQAPALADKGGRIPGFFGRLARSVSGVGRRFYGVS